MTILARSRRRWSTTTRPCHLTRAVGNRAGEASTMAHIGAIYDDLGEKQKALDSYTQSLPLSRATQDLIGEASTLGLLMKYWKSLQNPGLAVMFGKESIQRIQQVRRNIAGLEKGTQESFLKSKENYYRDLADLLIAEGRLPEAQQVLGLLKQQEYSDYVRGEAADMLSPLALTPAEKQAEEDYQTSTAQLVSLGEQWAELKKMPSRTPEQEKQYQQISEQLDQASKGLNDYYSRLYMLFGQNSDANRQVADVKGDVSALKQTIARMPHTVALYTLVGKDRISIIVITPAATVARQYAIPEEELNRKVAAFEQVLRDPGNDPKPLAQELYKILIAPVKADLDQAAGTDAGMVAGRRAALCAHGRALRRQAIPGGELQHGDDHSRQHSAPGREAGREQHERGGHGNLAQVRGRPLCAARCGGRVGRRGERRPGAGRQWCAAGNHPAQRAVYRESDGETS